MLIDWKQDFAGAGGDVKYIKSAIDAKYYTLLVADIVGLIHLQGGMLNQFGGSELRMLDHFQMGPNLVRGFAPNGIGPRDINPYGTRDALGGTKYWALRSNCRCRSGSCRRKSAQGPVYADAGGLFDYKGPTAWAQTGEVNARLHQADPRRDDWGHARNLFGIAVRRRQRGTHLGRCRHHLGFAVRSAALRLCGSAYEGSV